MSQLSVEEITHLAKLARIELTEGEVEKLLVDMPKIVDFVEELQGAESQALPEPDAVKVTALREDDPSSENLTLEELEKLAPKWSKNQVEVPAVFESNDVS